MSGQDVVQLLGANPRLWLVAGAVGLCCCIVTARRVFEGWSGFLEALRYWYQPGWLSLMRGEWVEDQWAQFKLMGCVVFTIVVTLGVKAGVTLLVIRFALVQKWHLPV